MTLTIILSVVERNCVYKNLLSFSYENKNTWMNKLFVIHTSTGWPVCHDMKQGAVNEVF